MRTILTNISKIFIILFFQSALAQNLPVPPAGFEWVDVPEIKGAFLKPKDWSYKNHKGKMSQTYYITKENIDDEGKFFTGLTINVIKNIPKIMNVSPTQFSKHYLSKVVSNKKIIKNPWRHSMGVLDSYGVVIKNTDPQEGNYNTHNLVICNDQTGTVYVVVYEAPTENWKDAWKIGEVILSKLLINPEV